MEQEEKEREKHTKDRERMEQEEKEREKHTKDRERMEQEDREVHQKGEEEIQNETGEWLNELEASLRERMPRLKGKPTKETPRITETERVGKKQKDVDKSEREKGTLRKLLEEQEEVKRRKKIQEEERTAEKKRREREKMEVREEKTMIVDRRTGGQRDHNEEGTRQKSLDIAEEGKQRRVDQGYTTWNEDLTSQHVHKAESLFLHHLATITESLKKEEWNKEEVNRTAWGMSNIPHELKKEKKRKRQAEERNERETK
ncbi:hypothetical protein BLNAU_25177 [Blattamonas nauphoetae]|uniref:Uncharacterized protein n=1 Tax=Blattamonas nauphoetae TaxID=2049346 RepID=A0ABQ9WKP6_9EUKA|nr:hypothetical protein BLNAU_25177 [Blattamonas nauphoetae]